MHHLPSEIFTEILLASFAIQESRTIRLKELAAVCTHWKDLVIMTPLLWSSISSFDPPKSVVPTLLRSGRSPLHIHLFSNSTGSAGWNPPDLSVAIHEVMKDVGRWKTVELEAGPETYGDLLPLQATSAPILEVLKLKIKPHGRRSRGYGQLAVAVDLFEGRASRLRVLHLDGITVPWHSALLRQVVHLELSSLVISKVSLHSLLACNLGLRRLVLNNIISPPPHIQIVPTWSPKSIKHEHLKSISIGWASQSPAQALLMHLHTPNCTSLDVDIEKIPAKGTLTPNALRTLDHISRHISLSSFDDVKIVWSLQASSTAARHINVQGTFRSPNSYDLRFTLPARFWAARRWIQAIMGLLTPVAPNLVVGVVFDWVPNTRHVTGTEHLMHFLGKIPNLKTMVNRSGVDGRLLRLMSQPVMLGGTLGWLFRELQDFRVEGGSDRTVATNLLEMVKRQYMGITADHDFADESDGEDDESIAQDSEESDEEGVSTDDDTSGNTPESGIASGPPPGPPPFWKTLELHGLQAEHADICAEIYEVANISSTFDHVQI